MSSIALKAENREWYLNARWIAFRKRPSTRLLQSQARHIGATHYVLDRGAVWMAGFFTFEDRVALKILLPAALAVAKHLGPNAYGTFEPVPGKLWIVATDTQGSLLPFSDTVLSADDLGPFEARLDPQLLEHRVSVDLSGIDTLLTELEPLSLRVSAAATPRRLILLGMLIAVAGGIGGCVWLWQQHEQHLRANATAAQKREQAREARLRADAVTVVTPDDWIAACLHAQDSTPLYASGWIAREWACNADTFSVVWIRSGGTLAKSPAGQADSKGDTIVSRVALRPRRVRPAPAPSGDAVRMLLARLQAAGVEADIHPETTQSVGGAPSGEAQATTQFVWPTDPRGVVWNAIPRLQLISIHASTGLAGAGGGRTTTPGTYRIEARITTGATP